MTIFVGNQTAPTPFQSFDEIVLSGEINLKKMQVLLAPIVDSGNLGITYSVGLVLAKYTSGNYAGCYVNYQPSGSNGSNVPVAILYDNFIQGVNQTAGTVVFSNGSLVPVNANGQTKVQVIVDGSAGADLKAKILKNGVTPFNYIYWTTPTGNDDLTTIFGTYGNNRLNGTLRNTGLAASTTNPSLDVLCLK